MPLNDETAVGAATAALGTLAMAIGGPVGIALGVLAEVAGPIYEVIKGGGDAADTVNAIKAAIVAAADAQMKAELGENS